MPDARGEGYRLRAYATQDRREVMPDQVGRTSCPGRCPHPISSPQSDPTMERCVGTACESGFLGLRGGGESYDYATSVLVVFSVLRMDWCCGIRFFVLRRNRRRTWFCAVLAHLVGLFLTCSLLPSLRPLHVGTRFCGFHPRIW